MTCHCIVIMSYDIVTVNRLFKKRKTAGSFESAVLTNTFGYDAVTFGISVIRSLAQP